MGQGARSLVRLERLDRARSIAPRRFARAVERPLRGAREAPCPPLQLKEGKCSRGLAKARKERRRLTLPSGFEAAEEVAKRIGIALLKHARTVLSDLIDDSVHAEPFNLWVLLWMGVEKSPRFLPR